MAEMIERELVSPSQSLVLQALSDGTYFVWEEIPGGTIDGVNATFTLVRNPNPDKSLKLRLNGQVLYSGAGNDFTLSGTTITMLNIPQSGDVLTASYTVSPV